MLTTVILALVVVSFWATYFLDGRADRRRLQALDRLLCENAETRAELRAMFRRD